MKLIRLTLRATAVTVATLLAVMATAVSPASAEAVQLNDNTTRLSYSLGFQIGGDFKRQGVEMDAAAVVRGIEDALAGSEPKIPHKAMGEILGALKRRIVSEDRKKVAEAGMQPSRRETELKFLAEGKEFLAANKGKPDVKITETGLQYRIVEPGSGQKPGPSDRVTVHYRGTLVNGNEFDSSYSREEPSTFSLDKVIAGFREGLQLIGEGGRIELFVPHALAYRNRGPMAHRTLIFDVELISVSGTEAQTSG